MTQPPDTPPFMDTESSSPQGKSAITRSLLKAFPAFANPDFRRYFPGQVISMIGTWMQMVAQGWLVYELTGSAFDVGMAAAATTFPTLFLSLFGGLLVDRYPRRTILFWTQSSAMLLAFILGIVTMTGTVTMGIILLLSFLLGCVNAINVPALQAFLSEIVRRDHLPSAIAMNSAIYNSSRVIGPALAGWLIAYSGAGIAFIVNGFSFFAVLLSLFTMKTKRRAPTVIESNPLLAIREGVLYAWNHKLIRLCIYYIAIVSVFSWAYVSMLPVIAKQRFGMDASGMGSLFGISGIGSVMGTIMVSMLANKIQPLRFIAIGSLIFAVALLGFTLTENLPLAMVGLFFAGFGLVAAVSTLSATIQGAVEDRFRGRVMSLYMMIFMGFMPLGNVTIGYLSDLFGTGFAIQLNCIVTIIAALLLLVHSKQFLRIG
uniref:Transporter, putative n=1 Tax=Chlorobium chlorochromatii (strain CaD3) TaxID=340177 RepID=Q3AP17_CHLCH